MFSCFFFVKLKRLWYTGHYVAMVTRFCLQLNTEATDFLESALTL